MSQLVITPENTDYTVPVTINHDSNVEDDEMFSVVLSTDEDGVRIESDTTEITITDASEWSVQYMIGRAGVSPPSRTTGTIFI